MDKARERGEKDFYKGRDLQENPYPRDSQERKEWDAGNWDAYDDYKKRHEEN